MDTRRLREVGLCFLKLGTIAFGGPAAHLSLMRSELVNRRAWLDEQEFLDLVGGASLLPGPTSTEVAIMLAKRRAGWPGLVVGGLAFIVPAMAMVLALSWAYVRYGSTGPGARIVEAVLPAIIAIIADAIIGLARQALNSWLKAAIAAAALAAYVLGGNPLLVLVGGLLVSVAAGEVAARRDRSALQMAASPALWAIFLEFLKLGAVVFGSGYVLFAYLRSDLVRSHHWLTLHQLLATAAIGQLTPGPVFTTATSIGYVVAGVPGAVLATVGIFLPSFLLVAAALPVIARVRKTGRGRAALDGLNAAALALITGVTVEVAHGALVNWWTAVEAVVAFVVLERFRLNSGWLILAGAVLGLALAIR
ncbi:MAG: chromate transporter [Acidimicrobiales bacterium]|jgi:chromate transporter